MQKLPNGSWIFFGNIAKESTDLEFTKFLSECGIEVGVERLQRKESGGNRVSIIVSLPNEEIARLVYRALEGRLFQDRELRITTVNKPGEPNYVIEVAK